jgi:hypothetical protein
VKKRQKKKALKKGVALINYMVFKDCCPILAGNPKARLTARERRAVSKELGEIYYAALAFRDAVRDGEDLQSGRVQEQEAQI